MAAKAVSLAKSIKVSFTKGQNPWCIASKGTISHKKECLPIEQNCKCANVQMCMSLCACVYVRLSTNVAAIFCLDHLFD